MSFIQDHEQTTLMEIGAEGCYLLCVKKIAELETGLSFNPVSVYLTGLQKGFVRSDCLLLDSAALLSMLTSAPWQKVKMDMEAPRPAGFKQGTYVVGEFDKKTPSRVATHFVLLNASDLSEWYNPLAINMKGWTLTSLRVFSK